MTEEDKTNLQLVSELVTDLPVPIRTGAIKAFGHLLGELSSIPVAWLRRPAQAIDDVTAGRSAISSALAKRVAEDALQDPEVMRAAAEIYLPSAVRKAKNKVSVAQLAIEHLDLDDAKGQYHPGTVSDDWLNAFQRFAEDASSEKLQDMFARILAGEVSQPGKFSLSTLRAVAELDQSTAEDFSLVWAKSVGDAVDYSNEFRRGEWFARWRRLAEAGLMSTTDTVQYLPDFDPRHGELSYWSPMIFEQSYLLVYFPQNCSARWPNIGFTKTGRQLSSILAPPDFLGNMRKAGRKFLSQGVARVELYGKGKLIEVLNEAAES